VEITKSLDNGTYTITLSDKFTFFDHAAFQEILNEIGREDIREIILDVAGVTFIDSAGLGLLLLGRDETVKYRKSLVIRGATGQVKKMFDVAHFETIFTLQK
jgi:anti-anti-sigma factor